MFTLGDLQKLYRGEKESAGLSSIPDEFRKNVSELLANPQAAEYAGEIQELYDKIILVRRNKITRYCMGPKPDGALENETPDDASLRQAILKDYKRYGKSESMPTPKVEAKKQLEKQKPTPKIPNGFMKVKFLQEMPKIVGLDGKEYGPYNKDDETLLPSQNAQILLKQEIIEQQ